MLNEIFNPLGLLETRQPISKQLTIFESGEILTVYLCENGKHWHKEVWMAQGYWTCVECHATKPILQQKYFGEINNYYQLNSIVFNTNFNWN